MSHDALREILTACGIKWVGVSIHTTQRGRLKPVVTGIPSSLFWHRYKRGLRSQMTAAGLTLKRLAKGQWEVVCWPRDMSKPILADLGFTIPEVEQPANPF
jgi:hypothetical protein